MSVPAASGGDGGPGGEVPLASQYIPRVLEHAARDAFHEMRRHSAFVKFMKRALPLTAAALGLAVLAYALQTPESGRLAVTFERMERIEGDLAMIRPVLTGSDDSGLPFVVSAASALQETAERVRLNEVQAEMALRDGTLLRLDAARGTVDHQTRALEVSGGIRFSADGGYFAETESASADLRSGVLSGRSTVSAHSPFGRLTASGFTFDRETKRLRFEGDVRMVLDGGSR